MYYRQRYIDKYGQTWERINENYVRRVQDWNIGGWFNGVGLTPITK